MLTIETHRMLLTEAAETEIDTILAMERHPENRDFIWMGTEAEHRREIHDPDCLLLLFLRREDRAVLGYALCCIDRKSHRFEVRRIVAQEKGQGYGREALKALIRYAFTQLDTHRLWLDVYPDNLRGIRLYESLGMHQDGVLRQNYLSDRGYLDQIIYSLLRSEYTAMESRFQEG